MKLTTPENFSEEPVIGHHVSAEIYEPESSLTESLDQIAEDLDIEPRNRERIEITVGDVDWQETKQLSIGVETFENLIGWYLVQQEIRQ